MLKKIGRNDTCFCGSGKKYKKCCLFKEDTIPKNDLNLSNKQIEDDIDKERLAEILFKEDTILENDLDLSNEKIEDDIAEQYLAEVLLNAGVNFYRKKLNKKPHINEYKKIRKLHEKMIDEMVNYYTIGKFEQKVDTNFKNEYKSKASTSKEVILLESEFNLESREGSQAFYDRIIYKISPNINCVTEEFIKNNRYRKPEKIEFLQSMHNSKLGLFEITDVEFDEAYVYLKEVFTGDEYKVTDTGMSYSYSDNNTDFYIYTRIITYNGISFSTGFNLTFEKTDSFIQNFIKRHAEDYNPLGEIIRFTELYNYFSKNSKKLKIFQKGF